MVKIQRHDSLSISQAEEALSIWSRRTSKPKAGNSLSLSLSWISVEIQGEAQKWDLIK